MKIVFLVLFAVVAMVILRFMFRNKGRRVIFRCQTCRGTETHFERGLDIRSCVNPKCACGGLQSFIVEGEDDSGDVNTFGRSPSEAGSLVTCACGARAVIPAGGSVTVHSADGERSGTIAPVACGRCRTVSMMHNGVAVDGCQCKAEWLLLRRNMSIRCTTCQQTRARIALMS